MLCAEVAVEEEKYEEQNQMLYCFDELHGKEDEKSSDYFSSGRLTCSINGSMREGLALDTASLSQNQYQRRACNSQYLDVGTRSNRCLKLSLLPEIQAWTQ